MNRNRILASSLLGALLMSGMAAPAMARQGADDAAGHVRQSQGADDTAGHIRQGRGADDAAGHVRQSRGADDAVKAGDDSGKGKGKGKGKSQKRGRNGSSHHGANHR